MLAHQLETPLYSLQCGTCGVWHAIPQVMYNAAKSEGGYWHCPNGHSRGFSEGSDKKKIQNLEAELAAERERKLAALSQANSARAMLSTTRSQLKGTKTRLKNMKARVANGVCPCCNRTFVDLQRHMHNKHPDFKASE